MEYNKETLENTIKNTINRLGKKSYSITDINNTEDIVEYNVLDFFTEKFGQYGSREGNSNGDSKCSIDHTEIKKHYLDFFLKMSTIDGFHEYCEIPALNDIITKASDDYSKEFIGKNEEFIKRMCDKFKGNIFEIIANYYLYKFGSKIDFEYHDCIGANNQEDDGIDAIGLHSEHKYPTGVNIKYRSSYNPKTMFNINDIKKTFFSNKLHNYSETLDSKVSEQRVIVVTNLYKRDVENNNYKFYSKDHFAQCNQTKFIYGDDIYRNIGYLKGTHKDDKIPDFWKELAAIMYNICGDIE